MTETGLTFEERGAQLKKDVEKDHKDRALANVHRALENAKLSPRVMAYMNHHQETGVSDLNMGISVPLLKIHSVGSSTTNHLPGGQDPEDGEIFYSGTQIAAQKMRVIILDIKKCRLEAKDDAGNLVYDKETHKIVYQATYLVAGLIDQTLEPFVIYVKGMSYNKIWELEEELKPYVTKRAGGIPLTMLKVDVSSTKEIVTGGKYKGQKKNVFVFELAMDVETGYPVIEVDDTMLDNIETAIPKAEKLLLDIISRNGMTEKEYNGQKDAPKELKSEPKAIVGEEVTEVEDVSSQIPDGDIVPEDDGEGSEDIPF